MTAGSNFSVSGNFTNNGSFTPTGQSVTFTATVAGASGTPTGTVNFRSGSTSIPGCGAVPLTYAETYTGGVGLQQEADLVPLRQRGEDHDGGEDPDPDIVPQALDWMPWSHISAGNIAFNGEKMQTAQERYRTGRSLTVGIGLRNCADWWASDLQVPVSVNLGGEALRCLGLPDLAQRRNAALRGQAVRRGHGLRYAAAGCRVACV